MPRRQRAQAALAPVSVLRRSHDHHREVPARLLAALPADDFHRRDQDRHVMTEIGARQNYKTARLLRRLSTSIDQARPRIALNSRHVVAGGSVPSLSLPVMRSSGLTISRIVLVATRV